MKVLIVSGFLGAGKTTFIEKLAAKVKHNIVVLENEYGQVGIDGDLLKKDKMNIWEMTDGCICCSRKSDFAASVLTIANTINPEVLIVEPTGAGFLSSVIENIKNVTYERIRLLEPVTIVDPSCIDRYTKEYKDVFTDQIKSSRQVVISKTADMSKASLLEAEIKVRKINPDALIYDDVYENYDENFWEGFLQKELSYAGYSEAESRGSLEIANIGFTGIEFADIGTFESYMGAIMRGDFGDIIRAKGFIPINGAWAKFDIVNKTYTLTPIEDMKVPKLILIGKNIDKVRLNILFDSVTNEKYKKPGYPETPAEWPGSSIRKLSPRVVTEKRKIGAKTS
ncbi:MAG: GTP-binding protein [Sphaerochaeta sp.]